MVEVGRIRLEVGKQQPGQAQLGTNLVRFEAGDIFMFYEG